MPKTILEYYNTAKWFTEVCPEQQEVFTWWKRQRVKPMLGCDTETTGLTFGLPTYLKIQKKGTSPNNCESIVNMKKSKSRYSTLSESVQSFFTVKAFGLSVALKYRNVVYCFWGRLGSPLYNEICKLWKINSRKAFHNARFDIRVCEVSEIPLNSIVDCTYTMSRIYWDRRKKHRLQNLSEILCPELSDWEIPIKKEFARLKRQAKKEGKDDNYVNYSFIDDGMMSIYAMTDAFMTLMLYYRLWPHMERSFAELYEQERKVFNIVKDVEKIGLPFNTKRAVAETTKLNIKMARCRKKMFDATVEHNPNSPKQVLDSLLLSGVPRKMLTLKNKLTTGADVLKRCLVELPKDKARARTYIESLLDYRSYSKTVGTYLIPLTRRAEMNEGIVYCQINPADSRTGRMASRDPNLQNIPEPIKRQTGRANPVRSCFVVRPGYVNYYFDYSQFEMVIFGVYAQEPRILEPYEAGEDIHGNMASYMYGCDYNKQERDLTKNTSYGVIYGLGPKTMSLMYGIPFNEARRFRGQYLKEFPTIKRFLDSCRRELIDYGYVTDWFGKRYHVPVGQAYKAVNCLVQGVCASIFKAALILIHKLIADKFDGINILLPVHDEFQIEVEQSKYTASTRNIFVECVIGCMTDIYQVTDRRLTLKVDVSKSATNWAEKKKIAA